MGRYSSQNQLLDLSNYLDSKQTDDFIPALYQAVKYDGQGLRRAAPDRHHLHRLPARDVRGRRHHQRPRLPGLRLELGGVQRRRRPSSRPRCRDDVYPFAYDWQQFGAYRWLTWLFEAGGRVLEEDLKTPAIVSAEGQKALEYTQNFFEQQWVPKNTSTKGASYPDTVFISQKIAMAFVGDFLLPGLDDGIKKQVRVEGDLPAQGRPRLQRPRRQRAGRHRAGQEPRPGRRVPQVHGGCSQHAGLLRGSRRAAHAAVPGGREARLRHPPGPDAVLRRAGHHDDPRGRRPGRAAVLPAT